MTVRARRLFLLLFITCSLCFLPSVLSQSAKELAAAAQAAAAAAEGQAQTASGYVADAEAAASGKPVPVRAADEADTSFTGKSPDAGYAAVDAALDAAGSAVPKFAASSAAAAPASKTCIPNTLHISDKVSHRPQKLTIAHRGASYHLPEHTLQAYRLALEMRADYIEPDLVATSDGQLIALHTVDLNVTTNVENVFGANRTWFSPHVNRTSYWTFNFTLAEIQTLTVQQRLPAARSTAFDGMFGVPSLSDILQMLADWNTVDLPLTLPESHANDSSTTGAGARRPTHLELNQAGIYIELKDAVWLKNDADIDLVDLLFSHLQDHADEWDHLLQCYEEIRFDAYKVPGLVIQSFDGPILQEVSERWRNVYNETDNAIPEPPLILLVEHPECWDDEFWFQVGDKWRDYIAGIGCNKICLLDEEGGAAFQEKAEEYNLVLHPWTERPERKYVNERFDSALEETQYLFCNRGAQGVFTESVMTAVLAANLGCPSSDTSSGGTSTLPDNGSASAFSPTSAPVAQDSSSADSDKTNQQGKQPALCSAQTDDSEASSSHAFVGFASFTAGAFVAAGLAFYMSLRRTKRFGRAVPSGDLTYDLEMT